MRAPPAQAVLDALPSEVVLLDRSGRIRACNASWRTFAAENGRPGADWVGTDYLLVCSGPDGGDAARAGIADVLAGRRDHFELEYPCHSPDERRWFEMRVRRLEPPHEGWVVLSHENVTGRHLAEEARREQWDTARRLRVEKERSEFMRTFLNEVSHEVRTPLSTLRLRCAHVAPEHQDALRGPLARIEQTLAQVDQTVRALSQRPGGGVVSLADLAAALDGCRATAARRDVSLEVRLPERNVRADAKTVGQTLALLTAHVLATCPAGGRVEVDVEEGTGMVSVHVVGDLDEDAAAKDLWLLTARHLASRANLRVATEQTEGRQRLSLRLQATTRPARPRGASRREPSEPGEPGELEGLAAGRPTL